MHKSVYAIGLLVSSLIMVAIMPFLYQNNSFSNVKAQEYDAYYGDSYSQYPTDEKKYECRTGPFEGFFTSSVEFCQFKFDKDDDSKRDNRIGTQGCSRSSRPSRSSRSNRSTGNSRYTRYNRSEWNTRSSWYTGSNWSPRDKCN